MTHLYLGVDGGGTKTEAVIINEDGEIVGKGIAGGSNASIFGLKESVDQVSQAVKATIDGKNYTITRSCLALAGVNTEKDIQNWKNAIKDDKFLSQILKNPLIVNDTLAAIRSGTTDKNAVVIISGTGSNCYGRNENGQETKSGGGGHILGDEGSAFDIGTKILHSVTKALDGRSAKTHLTELLFKKYEITSPESLRTLVYTKPWNKTDIAQVAPLVEIAAEKGDRIAQEIIRIASDELATMIKAVVRKLNLEDKNYTIVTTGSVFKIQKILFDNLEKEIIKLNPGAKFVKPSITTATAAAFLAKEDA